MNLSEQKKYLDANSKLDAKLVAIAGENLGWEMQQYENACVRFYIKPSLLGDGETLTLKYDNGKWEIMSRTEMKLFPSFTKNWLNVKKMYEEITMLLEYDNLDNHTIGVPQEKFNIPDKHWYEKVPWLSLIIVLIHGFIFWAFSEDVRDDAWQAERSILKDAGAFDRSLFYDGNWSHILKSFFFDFRPGILYVSTIAVLALGYTIETTMPRWFVLLILIVASTAGLFWAFDRTLENIYDTSQTVFAALLGIYISGLLTRAIYFPLQRAVALALFAYFGYWSMKADFFPVVDKHVFMGAWLFGIMGGLCWYIPFDIIKIRKVLAPMSIFVIYVIMVFWVYKTVNHDYLCIESFNKMDENIDPYSPRSYYYMDLERVQRQRSSTEKALIRLDELMAYKTTRSMWEVNLALQKFLKKLVEEYDYMLKQTPITSQYKMTIDEEGSKADRKKENSQKLFNLYYETVNTYWEKEHIRIPIITD
ncbi:MAG: hypothetical protein SGJ10_08500 [Bacteroidota bacterium]|nr:hypothetical protein [Bacteroidota bacterium]